MSSLLYFGASVPLVRGGSVQWDPRNCCLTRPDSFGMYRIMEIYFLIAVLCIREEREATQANAAPEMFAEGGMIYLAKAQSGSLGYSM
jgi:hypothetical protein